jgi:hypothetical protein
MSAHARARPRPHHHTRGLELKVAITSPNQGARGVLYWKAGTGRAATTRVAKLGQIALVIARD